MPEGWCALIDRRTVCRLFMGVSLLAVAGGLVHWGVIADRRTELNAIEHDLFVANHRMSGPIDDQDATIWGERIHELTRRTSVEQLDELTALLEDGNITVHTVETERTEWREEYGILRSRVAFVAPLRTVFNVLRKLEDSGKVFWLERLQIESSAQSPEALPQVSMQLAAVVNKGGSQ